MDSSGSKGVRTSTRPTSSCTRCVFTHGGCCLQGIDRAGTYMMT
jgi:hypothetical protein